MQPESKEPNGAFECAPAPDLFDELRDHANQWDVSGIWFETEPEAGNPDVRQAAE